MLMVEREKGWVRALRCVGRANAASRLLELLERWEVEDTGRHDHSSIIVP